MVQASLSTLTLYFGITCLASGFFSGVEAAYVSLNRLNIKRFERSNRPLSSLIKMYLNNIDMFLSAILLFNLFNNILATLLAKAIVEKVGPMIHPSFHLNHPLASLTFIGGFAFFFIIMCEVSPKRLSIHYAPSVALIGALPVLPVYAITYPIAFVLSRMSNRFINIFSSQPALSKIPRLSQEEFLGYMKISSQEGVLQKIETSMIESLISNKDMPVKSFLIPRSEMKALNLRALPENLFKSIQTFPYSTIPVYDGLKDNFIGVLSKRKIAFSNDRHDISQKTISKYLEQPKLIPESKRIIDVLADLHETNSQLAIVTDEHGGIEGIVTYNDIVNCLIGKETPTLNPLFIKKLHHQTYVIDPLCPLSTFNKTFKIHFRSNKVQTIGGYLLEHIQTIPSSGYEVILDHLRFTVREANKKQIIKLTVQILSS